MNGLKELLHFIKNLDNLQNWGNLLFLPHLFTHPCLLPKMESDCLPYFWSATCKVMM